MTLHSALFSQRQICSVHPQPPLPSLQQLSLTNILISKSALVFLEQLQGKTPFLISHCIHDADSLFLGSLFVWILCDLISNGGSTRHQRYWFGAEGCVVGW